MFLCCVFLCPCLFRRCLRIVFIPVVTCKKNSGCSTCNDCQIQFSFQWFQFLTPPHCHVSTHSPVCFTPVRSNVMPAGPGTIPFLSWSESPSLLVEQEHKQSFAILSEASHLNSTPQSVFVAIAFTYLQSFSWSTCHLLALEPAAAC